MTVKKPVQKILVGRIDITPLVKNAKIPIDKELRTHFAETRKLLDRLEPLQSLAQTTAESYVRGLRGRSRLLRGGGQP